MTPADRNGIRKLCMTLAFPLIAVGVVGGFLWQFLDYGWMVGNIAFNRLFEVKRG